MEGHAGSSNFSANGLLGNRVRGTRKAERAGAETPAAVIEGIPEQIDPEVSRAAWARLIKKGELRPLVRWTNAARRTPGHDVRAGGYPLL